MTPAYLQIHAELRRRIENGVYAADEPLPSQRALSEEFGVTVMTLRQAVDLLKRERVVTTRHGVGTFVAPRRFSYSIGPLRSLAQDMAAQGLPMRTEVLTLAERPAGPAVAAGLRVEPGEETVMLERLRWIESAAVVYQRSYLPLALGRTLDGSELEEHSLYDVLHDRLGVHVHHAHERLYPTVLDRRVGELLGGQRGDPALLSERVTFSATDWPILHDQAYMPGDRLVIATERRRSDVSIRYELLPQSDGRGEQAREPRRSRCLA